MVGIIARGTLRRKPDIRNFRSRCLVSVSDFGSAIRKPGRTIHHLFSVPLAVLGALAFNFVRGLPNDIFTQIGLVMLVGLSSKNGILIVEFANQLRAEGLSSKEAVIKSAEIRLRPILMTSFAFIFGLLPLLFSTGAGALARHSLGTAVIGGMLVSTALNLFVIPVFYVLFVRDKKEPGDLPPVGQSFEEGDFSVSDVFEDEPPQPDENDKKAGLINFINEEKKDDPLPKKEPEITNRKDEAEKESGNASSDDETKNE